MTYLEVKLQGNGVTVGGDPNRVQAIDYAHVTTAAAIAQRAFENVDATDTEKELANAIHSLVEVLTEIVAGLDHGRIGVHNYPTEDAHLEH